MVVLGYHLGRAIAPQLRDQAERDEIHELTLLGPNPDVPAPDVPTPQGRAANGDTAGR